MVIREGETRRVDTAAREGRGGERTAYGWGMRVLVSGGAGFIGSHTVVRLVAAGHDVVIVDSFANSKPAVIGRLGR